MESPNLFQTSTIISVPKPPKISSLNDYWLVAPTSIAMKVFECLVLRYLKSATDSPLDSHQFAYSLNRSVEDAVCLGLHHVLEHLDHPNIDDSFAFNTIIPSKLFIKLRSLNVNPQICKWILDFHLDRTQTVKVNTQLSEPLTLSTSAPQRCVLSPLLFTLFTNDCRSNSSPVLIFKFSDDTTIEGLITSADESAYLVEVERSVDWCANKYLDLILAKAKEMIIHFRKDKMAATPLAIKGQQVEIVDSFKFSGTTIANTLKWDINAESIAKKAQQCIFFLRQLKKFRVSKSMLTQSYRAIVESMLTFSVTL